jgi:hypothetical protein
MKCRTCKHWTYQPHGLGVCNGLTQEFKIVTLPPVPDKKGKLQKRGKMLTLRSGVTGLAGRITTPGDWYCKNWRKK